VTNTEVHVSAIRGGSGEIGISFADLHEVRLTAKI
jgi:hypothetical protein